MTAASDRPAHGGPDAGDDAPWDRRPRIGPHLDMLDVRPEDRRPGNADFPYLEDDLVLFEGRVCVHSGTSSVFGRTIHHLTDVVDPTGAAVGPRRISYVGRWDGVTPLADLQHLASARSTDDGEAQPGRTPPPPYMKAQVT